MSTRFVACPACARHVRAGECICPFCGAKAPCTKPLRRIGERLSRAAMHAVGAAGAVIVLGDCTQTSSQPAYGVPCTPDFCTPVEQDAGADTAVIAEASVGSPDASDASSTADASEPDASEGGESEAATDAPSDGPGEDLDAGGDVEDAGSSDGGGDH